MQLAQDTTRLTRRLDEIVALDFFDATGRDEVKALLDSLERRIHQDAAGLAREVASQTSGDLRGRTWVTRQGIQVDRIASAWLIRRFLDPEACFAFVVERTYEPQPTHVRFDMFEAEFTHEGDCCTFEVLVNRHGLTDAALHAIAEIVHDIDLKDDKFQRQEAAGLSRLLEGLTTAHHADEDRLERGSALFDDLYAYFQTKGR